MALEIVYKGGGHIGWGGLYCFLRQLQRLFDPREEVGTGLQKAGATQAPVHLQHLQSRASTHTKV